MTAAACFIWIEDAASPSFSDFTESVQRAFFLNTPVKKPGLLLLVCREKQTGFYFCFYNP